MNTKQNAKPVLLIGATGTVGTEVMRALVARGAKARALVRSDRSARALLDGIEPVRGDLRDEASLEAAVRDVSAVFYCSPHELDEEELADRIVRVCESANRRIVFVGVHVDGANRFVRFAMRTLFGWIHPHYLPKARLSERVRQARSGAVMLMPTNFYQNDELFRDDILAGEYTQPFGPRGINRVDVRDIGEAAARALCEPDAVPPGAYPLVGPESFSGEACATTWREALGRDVRYLEDRARWTAVFERHATGKKRADFIASYTILSKFHLATNPRDVAKTAALLGHAPRTYRDYVRESLAAWRSAKSGIANEAAV